MQYFLNKKDFIFLFILIFFNIFIGSKYLKKYEITSDNYEYLSMAINFAYDGTISTSNHLDKKKNVKIDRSPSYSIIISSFFNKEIIAKNSLECFATQKTNDCSNEISKIQIFNLSVFICLVICLYLILTQFCKNSFCFLSCLFFSCMSLFLTQIILISPELFSTFLLTLSSFLFFLFVKKKKFIFFFICGFFLGILISIKEAFILLPILIIFLSLKYLKNYVFIKIFFLVSFFYLPHLLWLNWLNSTTKLVQQQQVYIHQNENRVQKIIEDPNYISGTNITSSKANSVMKQRAVYSTIPFIELTPLTLSFIPKYGDLLLRKYYPNNIVNKYANIYGGRNYLYRNSTAIFLQEISKNKFNTNHSFITLSFLLIKKNLSMYLIQVPIFYFKGSFVPSGRTIFEQIFKKNFYTDIYLILNNIFGFFIIFSFFISLPMLIIKFKRSDIICLFIFSAFSIFIYSFFSHYVPRYSLIIFPICYVSFVLTIYYLFNNQK